MTGPSEPCRGGKPQPREFRARDVRSDLTLASSTLRRKLSYAPLDDVAICRFRSDTLAENAPVAASKSATSCRFCSQCSSHRSLGCVGFATSNDGRVVPQIVPASSQNRACGANSSQVGRSRKLLRPRGFARKNGDGRNADRRFANRRLQPLGHLTVAGFPNYTPACRLRRLPISP
jgi:hypothetical protein